MARILVIDDQTAVLATIEAILESLGHTAVVTENAKHGLAMIDAEDFDLLITDIFMPDIDGLETIRLARGKKPQLPIIVMSGSTISGGHGLEPNFLAMATKLGAIHSMRKPFKRAELAEAIAACLGGAQKIPDHGP